jgi:very-short-patch-repair endonuclease
MPMREYRFHPERRWRFDFAWPDHFIAVEVEGLTPLGGRHQRMAGFRSDLEKYNAAAMLGWLVLRFTDLEIKRGIAIKQIIAAFEDRNGKAEAH